MEPAASPSTDRRRLGYALLVAMAAGGAVLIWLWPMEMLAALGVGLIGSTPLALGLWPGIWIRRGERLPVAPSDLERRRPVWTALSELYLDTELDDSDHRRIARVLDGCGYTHGQLEEILYRELHPTLHANLLNVAGEWALFDAEWLEQEILRHGPRRLRIALIPGKWMVRTGWEAISAKLRWSER